MNKKGDISNLWHWMSRLYLDTEIDTWDLLNLAQKLAATNLSSEELDTILYEDVHPICCWNFTIPAGEWVEFDKDVLIKRISAHKSKPPAKGFFERAREREKNREIEDLKKSIKIDWEKTKMLVELIRNGKLVKAHG